MSDYIPVDIQKQIMLRLPVKSLLRFRQVSKRWKRRIDRPAFIRQYGLKDSDTCSFLLSFKQVATGFMYSVDNMLTFTQLNSPPILQHLKPIATSEGIWCFSLANDSTLLLWNPSINKRELITVPDLIYVPDSPKMVFGFGVSPVNLDLTLLKINYPVYQEGPWYVSVYTMRSQTWNNLENHCLPRESIRLKRSGQATVDRKIFWVASEKFFFPNGNWRKSYMLVSFDLVDHQFKVINIPNIIASLIPPPFYISSLGNSLVISGGGVVENSRFIYGWALEVEGDSFSSVTLLFNIEVPIEQVPRFVGFTNYNQPIIEVSVHPEMFAHTLLVWDNNLQLFDNRVNVQGNGGSFLVGPYKESLILRNGF